VLELPVDTQKELLGLRSVAYTQGNPTEVHLTATESDVLPGTLDLLVLKLLECGPNHGWGLAQRLEEVTDGVFAVNQGSLYPALQRLKRKGFVRSKWGVTENGRRARYYELTTGGGGHLQEQLAKWTTTSGAVNRVLSLKAARVEGR
jgi:transcriptional regulator